MSKGVQQKPAEAKIVKLSPPALKKPDWSDLSLDEILNEPRIGIKEIATIVGVSTVTAARYIKNDGLPAKMISGKWESREILVKRWLIWYLLQ